MNAWTTRWQSRQENGPGNLEYNRSLEHVISVASLSDTYILIWKHFAQMGFYYISLQPIFLTDPKLLIQSQSGNN